METNPDDLDHWQLGYKHGRANTIKKFGESWDPEEIRRYTNGWVWGNHDFWKKKVDDEYEEV